MDIVNILRRLPGILNTEYQRKTNEFNQQYTALRTELKALAKSFDDQAGKLGRASTIDPASLKFNSSDGNLEEKKNIMTSLGKPVAHQTMGHALTYVHDRVGGVPSQGWIVEYGHRSHKDLIEADRFLDNAKDGQDLNRKLRDLQKAREFVTKAKDNLVGLKTSH